MKTFKIAFIACMVLTFSSGIVAAQEDFRSDTSALATEHRPLIDQLRQNAGDKVWIKANPKTGVVSYIGSDPSRPIRQPVRLGARPTPEQAARGFLSVYGSLLGLQDQAKELRVMRTKQADRGRSFVRFQQVHAGVPVFGGESIIQLDASSNIISAHSKVLPGIEGETSPAITPEAAEKIALDVFIKSYQDQYSFDASSLQVSEPALWIYNPLLLGMDEDVTSLVWRIEITPDQLLPIREIVLVDAVSARVLLHFNQNPHLKHRHIYDHNNDPDQYLDIPGLTLTRDETGGASGITDVDKAYDYAGDTYDFYWTHHGRDSINGGGMDLISTTRYCDWSSCPYANAFWTGPPYNQMVYGQGYASADDVVAHEMTHGVTDYESNLVYLNQSGAINEAFSDIWGEFVDLTNLKGNDSAAVKWLCGEDLPIGAIRSLKNPPAYGDPDRMGSASYYCGTCDQGGVHWNSGVGNKAAFLMTDGGVFNGVTITGINITKVAKIFYEAQTNLLVSSSEYDDLANALHQGCVDLIGTDSIIWADCTQVAKAITAVEMLNDQGATPNNLIKNPGFEKGLPQSDWTESSSGGYEIITNIFSYCGDWMAYMGGYVNAVEYIYQDIAIPADATVASLQFWYGIVTSDWGTAKDKMTVEIRRPSDNALLKTLVTLSNLNAYPYWRKSTAYNLLAYKGQTIRLGFYTTNNDSNSTDFYVDDVVLKKLGGANPPAVASFAINNNAASTAKRTVILNNTAKNSPTEYIASANPDFLGAAWQPYSTAPSFTLSPGAGTKTVYFKVMNSEGESLVVTDTIEALAPSVTSLKINNTAASTANQTVTLNNIALYSPTLYMASESDTFVGAVWQAYSAAPCFALSTNGGIKRVYFRVSNEFDISPTMFDEITALAPTVTYFKINNNAVSTAKQLVTLNNTATNLPTHYRASEGDINAATWQTYAAAPSFTLSAGIGTKTINFQVRNGFVESAVVTDDINTLAPVVTLFRINNGALSTANGWVTLNNTVLYAPTLYRASETDINAASWQAYSAAPKFLLSAGPGTKWVHFQVMNGFGVSEVKDDDISAAGSTPVLTSTSFKINAGAVSTAKQIVTLNNTATNLPTQYRAAEGDINAATWQIYSAAPSFTLSAGSGVKTVNFQVKNIFGDSGVVSDTITALAPAVTLRINNNAVSTAKQIVTLNNTATNLPTHYRASETDINAATWQTYAAAPSFTLSAGIGTKTINFQVRNGFVESAVVTDDINALAPVVTLFRINNGALSTTNGWVTLNNTATNLPTLYRASETDINVASWQTYAAAPKFLLSDGAGTKWVHFQVMNGFGVSVVKDDDISTAGSAPMLTSFRINAGAASTAKQIVTLNNTATNLPTQYRVSETDINTASWQTYAAAPSFTLSVGSGTKTVWFQVRNIFSESGVLQDTILALAPAVTSFKINAGAASTSVGNGLVTLNNTATNLPTLYRASETDINAASWQTYTPAPKFTLSNGPGTKTINFQVKNGFAESTPVSDTILASGSAPVVTSFKINKGAASTTTGTVTLNNTATNLPTLYMASEDPTFAGAVWQTYAAAPSFALSAGSGTKTIYFRLRNIFDWSAVVSDTIYRY